MLTKKKLNNFLCNQRQREFYAVVYQVNVRENRRGNRKWTIHRNWQHKVHKMKTKKTKTKRNMCWAPL